MKKMQVQAPGAAPARAPGDAYDAAKERLARDALVLAPAAMHDA